MRRIVLCAARRDPRVFLNVDGHANPLMRLPRRLARGLVIRLARAGHHASDLAAEEDVAALPRTGGTDRMLFQLAMSRDIDPIHGTLEDGVATAIEFTGWLELMAAVDTVRARAPTTAPPASPGNND